MCPLIIKTSIFGPQTHLPYFFEKPVKICTHCTLIEKSLTEEKNHFFSPEYNSYSVKIEN